MTKIGLSFLHLIPEEYCEEITKCTNLFIIILKLSIWVNRRVYLLSESMVEDSWTISSSPDEGPNETISYGVNISGRFSVLKISSNECMSCKANYSCLRLSPVLTIKCTNRQDLKWPYGDCLLNLSDCSASLSPNKSTSRVCLFNFSRL